MKPIDDIPEALRDNQYRKTTNPNGLIAIASGLLALVGTGLIALAVLNRPPATVEKPVINPSPPIKPTPSPIVNVLGHLLYEEAPEKELAPITTDGAMRLRKAAAKAFIQMQSDARRSGVILMPISAFRSKATQDKLFFEVKEQRNQETRKRAEVSAPPGYSEHHTGYAIDIGDGRAPATNLSSSFANTAAFRWLQNNAAQYSFELSFPENNPQGINYEPWHWRFVGDSHSLETFYKAQQLGKQK
ncbi:M15 family metallopeptidase [Microcystis wesenbergii]|uniref:D-alanyl-D-alanine carboxypeptidase family protein n=1 Tax=Microcystis wesenbergii NRERC-220 TaxID=3068991 RepID=A0ABU3HN93_9CHRO|nr:D-alanyl-D-alanine carboxypeptidase family protein [Microcystis wesenbergii]MDT3675200.1 D-alanyl-D-alanine carboxypeptidase family protein [Microcystis wesenbergii NRERC-220]